MKFLTQVVLPILLVVGLIGGVTFVSHYSGPGKSSKKSEPSAAEAAFEFYPPLKDGQAAAQWDENELNRAADFEIFSEHHYDFALHNRGPVPLTVGLKKKNCTCANVRVTPLSPAEAEYVAQQGPGWAKAMETGDRWKELDAEGTQTATVPAGGWGLVRVNWQGRKLGPDGLRAQLWIDRGGSGRDEPVLLVPVNIVPPIQVPPVAVTVPDLTGRGPEQKVEFPCWSSTRPKFPLTVREEDRNPCIRCETKPLDAKQCVELAKRVGTPVRSGYAVTVKIRERRGEQQLDLGPFRRRLLLRAGLAESESATVLLEGMVRGEVTFLNAADKDRIDLGDFPAKQGAGKTVPLLTEQAGQQLEVDSWKPALLVVKLVPAGGRRWDLTVDVPANRPSGRLPDDSAVILRTRGAGARRMRIPVVGQATR